MKFIIGADLLLKRFLKNVYTFLLMHALISEQYSSYCCIMSAHLNLLKRISILNVDYLVIHRQFTN